MRAHALQAVLGKVEGFLLEPVEQADDAGAEPPAGLSPVVAVFSLGARSGGTVVSRALATELAGRYEAQAAGVSARLGGGGVVPLASPAAARLARALADVPRAQTRASGRLCLVDCAEPLALADSARHLAPLVLDAGSEQVGGVAAAVADLTLLVATPRVDPALASVAAGCLERVGRRPLVVLNRSDRSGWPGPAAVELPESRLGARLALAGREPPGELGRAVGRLADLVCEVRP